MATPVTRPPLFQNFPDLTVRDKIEHFLRGCDIVIADCTGSNANVFYELGIAHALGKDTILITQDSIRDVASDIRPFEFIKYDLGSHEPFLTQLDSALRELLVGRYERLYAQAIELFRQFREDTALSITPVSKHEFIDFIKNAESGEGIPSSDDRAEFAEFALPAVVRESGESTVMSSMNTWLRNR